ncbi:MAG TPA: hypothetical protein VIN08_13375 [Ohtaekwangia sp.]|uniref:hypothetical protein n=1 Tax=Ohtaekwangia sp. TaxID=2066019 RepID=UPI002F9393F9
MKHLLSICTFISLLSCSTNSNKSSIKSFNNDARTYFINNEEAFDLAPLSESEKCIIKKSISNDLDEINNWRTVTISDQFYIRNYRVEGVDFDFSFVKDSVGNFYFISLPQIHDYIYSLSNYYDEIDNFFVLKDSIDLVDISSPFVDKLTESEIFAMKNGDFGDKFRLLDNLMHEIFELFFLQEISIGEFENEFRNKIIGTSSNRNYNKVKELLNKITTSSNYVIKSCAIKEVGYVLFVYSLENQIDNQIRIKIYFLPQIKRSRIAHSDISTKYKDCFSLH